MQKNILPILFLSLGLAGCATSSITNLTPSKVERNSSGTYPIEMAWASRERTLLPRTMQPKVQSGLQEFPMQPTPIVTNRWEVLVPVPASEKAFHYRFKVDYECSVYRGTRKNSKLSPEYSLEIVEKK